MSTTRRSFTDEDRAAAVARVVGGEMRKDVQKSLKLSSSVLSRWLREAKVKPTRKSPKTKKANGKANGHANGHDPDGRMHDATVYLKHAKAYHEAQMREGHGSASDPLWNFMSLALNRLQSRI